MDDRMILSFNSIFCCENLKDLEWILVDHEIYHVWQKRIWRKNTTNQLNILPTLKLLPLKYINFDIIPNKHLSKTVLFSTDSFCSTPPKPVYFWHLCWTVICYRIWELAINLVRSEVYWKPRSQSSMDFERIHVFIFTQKACVNLWYGLKYYFQKWSTLGKPPK